jgi:mannose-6-phosphate isomerase-like protein (cupin superfamily)
MHCAFQKRKQERESDDNGPNVAISGGMPRLKFRNGFHVALTNKRGQAAEMVIAPGDCEGGADNKHRGADQWLFVIAGRGMAIVNGKRQQLAAGSLVLIERGDTHEIRNTGRTPLKTLNVYVPPAYRSDGDPLPRGRK